MTSCGQLLNGREKLGNSPWGEAFAQEEQDYSW
jgi:hypothetical protein